MPGIEFGLFDEFPHDRSVDAEVIDEHICDVQAAEQLGYRYYFFIEHQNAGFPCITAPSVYLAAVARATSSMRIGPMVYQLPMHHPVRLAQDAAFVDQLSHGRLEFSVGYGTRAQEFERWHVPFGERRERGIEALEIVLQAWANDRFSYAGTYWSFTDALPAPRPYQQPHPPIWIGGHSHASFDYAAEHNYDVAQNRETEQVTAAKFAYFRQAWERHNHPGPPPRTMLVRHVHVAETDELAREQAERHLLHGLGGEDGVRRARSLRPEESTPAMLEISRIYLRTAESYDFWIDEGLALVGSPETVARTITERSRSTGYTLFAAQHRIWDMPLPLVHKSMELFAREVIPALAG